MSQSQTADQGDDDVVQPLSDEEIDRVARAQGWKPREQYRGKDPDGWVDARTFVQRGFETPAVMRRQNIFLSDKVVRLENMLGTTQTETAQVKSRLDETLATVGTMTTMMRNAEERGYKRAREELKGQMAKAVESADVPGYAALERQLEELEKDRPLPAPKVTTTQPTATPTPPPVTTRPPDPSQLHPSIQAFFERNKAWYDPANQRPERDIEMMRYADEQYLGILSTQKDLPMDRVMAEVERRMQKEYPEKMGVRSIGGGRRDDPDNDDNGRRDDPPLTNPRSDTPPGNPRPRGGRRTFDSMPQDVKDSYARYKRDIDSYRAQKGNHIPELTKQEWAEDYYAQDGT